MQHVKFHFSALTMLAGQQERDMVGPTKEIALLFLAGSLVEQEKKIKEQLANQRSVHL